MDGTPLSIAAGNGHLVTVGLLLDRGAIIDQQDRDGSTPSHHAIAHYGACHDLVYLLLRAVVQQGCVSVPLRTLH